MNTLLENISRNNLKTQLQRAAYKLIKKGTWVSKAELEKFAGPNVRARDLRKEKYGFDVECVSAEELNKRSSSTHFYRINPSSVSKKKVQRLFNI